MARVIAITGAARGIGLATAREILARGGQVAIGDIDKRALDDAAEQLGDRSMSMPLDVTDPVSFENFFEAVVSWGGGVDVLVNNAGIMPTGHVHEQSLELMDKIVDIGYRSVLIGTRLALNHMLPKSKGHVVNVASLAGLTPVPGISVYSGVKAAVVQFTEGCRLEYRDSGVNFSSVLPAFVDTELTAGTKGPRLMGKSQPSEIAEAIANIIERPRPQVIVPTHLTPTVKLGALYPEPVKKMMSRFFGMDQIFLDDVDEQARRVYNDRVNE